MTSLHDSLLDGYKPAVRPGSDYLNQAVKLNMTFGLKIIKSFDELDSRFSIVGHFTISWYDERMTWDPRIYDGISMVQFHLKDVWIPPLTYSISYNNVDLLGDPLSILSFTNGGEANWEPSNIFDTVCNADISYYPFDNQTCELSVFVVGYDRRHIQLHNMNTYVGLKYYTENPVWELLDCKISVDAGILTLKFSFKRRSAFIVVNLMLPLLSLCILNLFVFVLPVDSNERVGFSITILLSITVFMSIVSDLLPNASSPRIAIFCYLLLLDVIISGLISICTILSIKLYTKPKTEGIPTLLFTLQKRFNDRKTAIGVAPISPHLSTVTLVGTNDVDENLDGTNDGDKKESKIEKDIRGGTSWTDVGRAFRQSLYFCVFLFADNRSCHLLSDHDSEIDVYKYTSTQELCVLHKPM
ncbi:acetylcholine receptor subunit beta-type acr-3-like [Pecten maximus]|uniref:acetylcholine receptor subunit beta-type acr-3-like n=1 Tax=Pecten maximus TaxID=6579 RepID=UPI001458A2A8|nr:acetylcholine receptor subunit beta-type acr-3-like [Pecten maximus]